MAQEENQTPRPGGTSPKALEEGSLMNEAFDESILAEIEQRLENGEDEQLDDVIAVGDKVELDRADLPLDGFLPEGTDVEHEEVEVDLADQDLTYPDGEQEEAEEEKPPGTAKRMILAAAAVLIIVAIAGGVGFWYSRQEGEKIEKPEEMPPWMFAGQIPLPSDQLRLELEPFIVPLLNSKEGNILRMTVTVEAMDAESKTELTDRVVDMRDVIYRALRDRPATELKQAEKKRLLQAQLKAELNHSFKQLWVHRVDFTQFLISG